MEEALGGRVSLKRAACGLGCGQPRIERAAHPGDPFSVLVGIEPKASGRAIRMQESVPMLQRPEQLGTHPHAAREFSDAKRSGTRRHRLDYTDIVQTLDRRASVEVLSVEFLYNFCLRKRIHGEGSNLPGCVPDCRRVSS